MILEEDQKPIKQDSLSYDDVRKWKSRAKTCVKAHTEILNKRYKVAKERYGSEISALSAFRHKFFSHGDINLLYKDLRDFIGSVFYRNPELDLTSRNDDEQSVWNVENLEQKTNDDIKDDRMLKGLLRQLLIDEGLAGFSCAWIDYEFKDIGNERVKSCRIRPENLIRPPWLQMHNYKESPYLGYVDIVSLEELKRDPSVNQEVVAKLKGSWYREIADVDESYSKNKTDESNADDIKHVKKYVIFIKGCDDGPMKRLVLCDEDIDDPLAYDDFDNGHFGYPIHVLALNECADGFIPPSEAWILEPLLQCIDYVFQKMNRHLRKSSTRTFYLEGQAGLKKAQVDKIMRNIDQEFIGLSGLPPGTDVRSLVTQIVDQMLSQDHIGMFDLAMNMFHQLSRQPTFATQEAINKDKTATETQAIQMADSTENGDYIDKFKDFLIDFFGDWARLNQRNFQGVANISIDREDGETDVRNDITASQMQGEFNCDINVDSFLPPNKEVKRRTIQQTLIDLQMFEPGLRQQGKAVNWGKAILEYVQNVDLRNPQDIIVDDPKIMELTQALLSIFSNDVAMAQMEQAAPGITQPLVGVIKHLASLSAVQPQGGPPVPQTDMAANASQMGAVQRGNE